MMNAVAAYDSKEAMSNVRRELFAAQGHHGIHFYRATGRKQRC